LARHQGSDLGNADLEIAQDLEQKRLELAVRLVDLVDEQDRWLRRRDRAQQRSRQQEAVGEEDVVLAGDAVDGVGEGTCLADHLADLVLEDLGVQELLGVLPLVQRLGFVQPLVALQTDELVAERACDHLGEFGLADAGRTLDEDRLVQRAREIDHGRDPAVADVLLGADTSGRRPRDW
jgi:hypothetical protein